MLRDRRDAWRAAEDGLDRRITCARATLAHGENFLEVAQLHEIGCFATSASLRTRTLAAIRDSFAVLDLNRMAWRS
jgi:hypothetical protein